MHEFAGSIEDEHATLLPRIAEDARLPKAGAQRPHEVYNGAPVEQRPHSASHPRRREGSPRVVTEDGVSTGALRGEVARHRGRTRADEDQRDPRLLEFAVESAQLRRPFVAEESTEVAEEDHQETGGRQVGP